jgi:hypothetical protein
VDKFKFTPRVQPLNELEVQQHMIQPHAHMLSSTTYNAISSNNGC